MINESRYAIVKHIDNGQYFRDSLDWYIAKYLYCYTYRTYLFLIMGLVGFCLFPLYFQYQQVSTTKHYPFPIYSIDEVKYYPVIKSLASEKEPITVSIARYLAGYYVQIREEYRYENQFGENKDILYNKLESLSSHKVFRDYTNYMDPDFNPDSPLVLYKTNKVRTIRIQEVKFIGNQLNPDSAKITYEATERNNYGEQKSNWRAELDFNMDNTKSLDDKQSHLSFLVTRYRTYKL